MERKAAMSEEKLKILEMLKDGKITADDAVALLKQVRDDDKHPHYHHYHRHDRTVRITRIGLISVGSATCIRL